jgi:outer membrane protein
MFRNPQFCFVLVFALGAATLSAQTPKYGHMNLGNLLELMPETKKANEDLKVFTDKLAAKDDSLTKAFSASYQKLEKEYGEGGLTPVQLEQRKAELQKQQEFIQKFEQDAQQMVGAKREELLRPILNKITETIKTVAKENSYLMVFDTSSGVMLFANDSDDVTALVKKKLGI